MIIIVCALREIHPAVSSYTVGLGTYTYDVLKAARLDDLQSDVDRRSAF